MKRALAFLFIAALAGGSGCYHLGPVSKLSYRSVAVPVFKNKTLKPQLEAQISNAIIKRIQADGTLRVEWEADADIVVTGTILRFDRTVLRFQTDDSQVPREYRLSIEAMVEAHDHAGHVVLAPQSITGHADTFLGNDLQSAEQQALPLIADDLARQIVSRLVERW